jgi:hypothetical protein
MCVSAASEGPRMGPLAARYAGALQPERFSVRPHGQPAVGADRDGSLVSCSSSSSVPARRGRRRSSPGCAGRSSAWTSTTSTRSGCHPNRRSSGGTRRTSGGCARPATPMRRGRICWSRARRRPARCSRRPPLPRSGFAPACSIATTPPGSRGSKSGAKNGSGRRAARSTTTSPGGRWMRDHAGDRFHRLDVIRRDDSQRWEHLDAAWAAASWPATVVDTTETIDDVVSALVGWVERERAIRDAGAR